MSANGFLITRTVTPQTIQQRLSKANLFIEEILISLDESDGITSLSFSYNRSRARSSFQLPNLLSVFLEHPCMCVCRRTRLLHLFSSVGRALLPFVLTGHQRVPRQLVPIKTTREKGPFFLLSPSDLVYASLHHWLYSTSGKCELNCFVLFCFKPQGREFFSSCNF